VGQTVLSKKYGTHWRIVEKREVWQDTTDDPETEEPRLMQAIHLTYQQIGKGVKPEIGKIMGFSYTLHHNSFEANWKIVKSE